MTTRVTEGARQERHKKNSSFFFSGGRSTLARAWTPLAKSEEKRDWLQSSPRRECSTRLATQQRQFIPRHFINQILPLWGSSWRWSYRDASIVRDEIVTQRKSTTTEENKKRRSLLHNLNQANDKPVIKEYKIYTLYRQYLDRLSRNFIKYLVPYYRE